MKEFVNFGRYAEGVRPGRRQPWLLANAGLEKFKAIADACYHRSSNFVLETCFLLFVGT
jgi:hypothetical protein